MACIVRTARQFATAAHEGQFRWDGRTPYISHPIAVSLNVKHLGINYEVVALLHDVVEDTDVTLEEVEGVFGKIVAAAVDAITKRYDGSESYIEYIQRVKSNPIATAVKIADIKHNLTQLPTGKDGRKNKQRKDKYQLAILYLEN